VTPALWFALGLFCGWLGTCLVMLFVKEIPCGGGGCPVRELIWFECCPGAAVRGVVTRRGRWYSRVLYRDFDGACRVSCMAWNGYLIPRSE
jgi:hypothetical protein